jgi:hypothetical protein
MTRTRLVALACLTVALSDPAWAHTTSTGLATLRVDGTSLTYRLTLVLSELPPEPARQLAAAASGEPASLEAVGTALREKVAVRAGNHACPPGRARVQGSRLGDGRVVLELHLRCPAPPPPVTLREDWADLFGEHYRTLVRIEGLGPPPDVALTPETRAISVEGGDDDPHRGGFFRLGVEHILTGYDHLLFLAALLLGGGGALALLKVITAFTVAHSLALAAALLGVVAMPEQLVEAFIAASIACVALENLVFRHAPSRRWLVAFGFGLVHGLGFAAALGSLLLSGWALAGALVGFNLGVEAGQAAVVALVLPLLVLLRRGPWERQVARALSLALVVVGVVWCLQRLFFA